MVKLNKYGYYELTNMPSEEELNYYYSTYYQDNKSASYKQEYTQLEKDFFKAKLQQKHMLCGSFTSFLDVGCGEGFALKYFHDKGYTVKGIDYSDAGLLKHNPDMKGFIDIGNIFDILEHMTEKFDIVNLDNVLEHVREPRKLLEKCIEVCSKKIIIKVPNDFSYFQRYVMGIRKVEKNYWVVTPDHINYFNKDGLINLCKAVGLEKEFILGNYLTEFYALHKDTNYLETPSLGRECHFARCHEEVLFNKIGIKETIELYKVYGKMGLGREIIGGFTKC